GEECAVDPSASAKLKSDLALAGVFAADVRVVSARLYLTRVEGVEPSTFRAGIADVRELISRSLGVPVVEPKLAVGEGGITITTRAAERYRVVMGKCSLSATGGVCGDSAAAFVSRDGYFRALISDGMG
ncbi:hypothetical protein RCJ22_37805, partial [Vibrio sp. FNV 38]|nr:hypothetical protein [Vibrio sp. FNV 38]